MISGIILIQVVWFKKLCQQRVKGQSIYNQSYLCTACIFLNLYYRSIWRPMLGSLKLRPEFWNLHDYILHICSQSRIRSDKFLRKINFQKENYKQLPHAEKKQGNLFLLLFWRVTGNISQPEFNLAWVLRYYGVNCSRNQMNANNKLIKGGK